MLTLARRLEALGRGLDAVNRFVGHGARWLAVAMLLVQITVVVLRYVFGTSFIAMQESVLYLHAALFMLGAGYTLLVDGHVRVDIFYGEASAKRKAAVDLFGVVTLLVPTCVAILFYTWNFVRASWQILEGPISVGGIPALFVLKTLIPLFAVLVLLQGLALGLKSLSTLLLPAVAIDPR
ncbi:MAG: TRAP transporter small permease subunit [Rhodospirillaceae bacterium]|nr:TRAP transporter small permease subunit [Rhodospirillaceae bacterium]